MRRVRVWCVGAALGVVTPLHAQQLQPQLADFAMQLPLTVSGDNGVVQLRLPQTVYEQSLSPELADLRIFNAAGQSLPYALVPLARTERVRRRESSARLFPIYGNAAAQGTQTDLDVRVATDGSLISVRSKGADPSGAQRLSALILDLGAPAAEEILESIQLLRSGAQTYRAALTVDRSDDLKLWDRVAQSSVDWLQGAQADQALVNDRIEIRAAPSRYLRIQWVEGSPLLFEGIAVRWRSVESIEAAPFEVELVPTRGKIAGDLLYAAPPAIAATQVGLAIGTENTVLPASIGYYQRRRNPPEELFVPVAQGTFYRLTQAGKERSSSNIQIAPWSAAQWVVRASEPSDLEPKLVLRWYPSTLVFTARSAAAARRDFVLAVGAAQSRSVRWTSQRTSLDRVAPGFSTEELATIEQAVAGEWQRNTAAPAAAAPRSVTKPWLEKRSVLLWGVLIVGTLVLAGMTWRLYQQVNKAPPG